MPTRILLKKHRFKCYYHSKMVVAETSFIKKNHQIPRIINQNIAQKLIEKTSMTDIAHQLLNFSSPTTVDKEIKKLMNHSIHQFQGRYVHCKQIVSIRKISLLSSYELQDQIHSILREVQVLLG